MNAINAPVGARSAAPGYFAPPAQAPAYAPAMRTDYWAPTSQPAPGGFTAMGSGDGGWIGWLAGALAAGFWALPKLARFGPVGFFTGVIVVLAGGFYGGRVVGAGQELLAGQPRGAVQVGAWFVGAKLAASAIQGWRNPGALMAAFVIWLGSWGAGKLLDMVWKK